MSNTVPRVYALGSTPVLKNIALSLAQYSKQPKPVSNIILLLKDNMKLNRFLDQGSYLSTSLDISNTSAIIQKQFMASCEPPKFANEHISPIENLIISEPTYLTFKEGLKKYSECLKNNDLPSNVLLINPGLDTIRFYEDQWNKEQYFSNLFVGITQPLAIIKNGEFSTYKNENVLSPLSLRIAQVKKVVNEENVADNQTEIKIVDHEEKFLKHKDTNSGNNLIDILEKTANEFPNQLVTSRQSYEHLLIESLEKLCLEACVGAMNVIYNESNMNLLKTSDNLSNVWNKMTREFNALVQVYYPNLSFAFSQERMNKLILQYLHENKNKTLPMQIELNTNKKHNSIHRANGMIVRMASFKNLSLPTNELIYNMIQSKINLSNQ